MTSVAATGMMVAAGNVQEKENTVLRSNLGDTAGPLPVTDNPGEMRGEMLYRELGSTGVKVSAIGMGGFHLGKPDVTEVEAIRLVQEAADRGITFFDNCWDYNDGQSEIRLGKALKDGRREKVFVMTKIDGRTKEAAKRQIESSLERLQTDRVDLLQHHEVLRFDDPDRIFAEGGAMEAVVEAQKAGKVRFIGFTGHKDPRIHLYMLKVAKDHGFHFDTAQMPLNLMDAHFRSFARLVVPELVKQKTGVLGMKPFCGGEAIILKSGAVQPMDCLHYALSLPTSVVITGIEKQMALDQAFNAVKNFKPLDREQMASLAAKTREVATAGKFELFKTTSHFDSTAKHPDWLGGDTEQVQELAPGQG